MKWSHHLTHWSLKRSPQSELACDENNITGNPEQQRLLVCRGVFLSVGALRWTANLNQQLTYPPPPSPPPVSDSGLRGLYIRQHRSAITCSSELCQLCLRLSLPATTVRGLSERQALNIDQTCHYQDHLREKLLFCSELLFPIMR